MSPSLRMTSPRHPKRCPIATPTMTTQRLDVEDEVAGLAQVAALRAHRLVVVRDHAEPLAAQHLSRGLEGGGGLAGILELDVVVEPAEVAGGRGGWARRVCQCSRLRGMMQPDERDDEQQVDRREPDRRVDVEEAEPVEPDPGRGVAVEEVGDLGGVDGPLREDRAGHRGDRQQQQQEERGAHRGERAPAPTGPSRPGRGRAGSPARATRSGWPSEHRLEAADEVGLHPRHEVGPHAAEHEHADDEQQPSAEVVDGPLVAAQPGAGPPGPGVAGGDDDERDAEADRVGDGEDDPAPDGAGVGAERGGEREDRRERGPGARRPAESEGGAEERARRRDRRPAASAARSCAASR